MLHFSRTRRKKRRGFDAVGLFLSKCTRTLLDWVSEYKDVLDKNYVDSVYQIINFSNWVSQQEYGTNYVDKRHTCLIRKKGKIRPLSKSNRKSVGWEQAAPVLWRIKLDAPDACFNIGNFLRKLGVLEDLVLLHW